MDDKQEDSELRFAAQWFGMMKHRATCKATEPVFRTAWICAYSVVLTSWSPEYIVDG